MYGIGLVGYVGGSAARAGGGWGRGCCGKGGNPTAARAACTAVMTLAVSPSAAWSSHCMAMSSHGCCLLPGLPPPCGATNTDATSAKQAAVGSDQPQVEKRGTSSRRGDWAKARPRRGVRAGKRPLQDKHPEVSAAHLRRDGLERACGEGDEALRRVRASLEKHSRAGRQRCGDLQAKESCHRRCAPTHTWNNTYSLPDGRSLPSARIRCCQAVVPRPSGTTSNAAPGMGPLLVPVPRGTSLRAARRVRLHRGNTNTTSPSAGSNSRLHGCLERHIC